jgi:hypothetical protein
MYADLLSDHKIGFAAVDCAPPPCCVAPAQDEPATAPGSDAAAVVRARSHRRSAPPLIHLHTGIAHISGASVF